MSARTLFQFISALLIIYRVAYGRAWSSQTSALLSSVIPGKSSPSRSAPKSPQSHGFSNNPMNDGELTVATSECGTAVINVTRSVYIHSDLESANGTSEKSGPLSGEGVYEEA